MRRTMIFLAAVAAVGIGLGGCTRFESTYRAKVTEAEGLNKDLAALSERYGHLEEENRSLREKIGDLTGEREYLKENLEFVTGERDRLAADNRELDRTLKAKADSLSRMIVDLRGQIADLERENETLRREVAELTKAQEEKVEKISKSYGELMSKMEEEIRQGKVTISELRGKLTLNMVDAILFDTGKAEIKPEGLAVLKKIVSILRDEREKEIRIQGYTDNIPIAAGLAKTYPTNWELSAARAINVTRYLQEQGIAPGLLSAVAYGEHRPVGDNDTPEGRAKNRRIEIILAPRE